MNLSDITLLEAGVAMGIVGPVAWITWKAAMLMNKVNNTLKGLDQTIKDKIDYDDVVHWICRMRDLNPEIEIPHFPEKKP